jgi:hypothetical protein
MIIDVIFFISILLAFIKGFSRGFLVALLFVFLYAIVFGLVLYFIEKIPFIQSAVHDSLAYKYVAGFGFKVFSAIRELFS